MAQVNITGALEWEMDQNGRKVQGFTVYYDKQNVSREGRFAAGTSSGKLKVPLDSALHRKMMNADYSEPFPAEVEYEFVPGAKNAQLVDIIW